MSQEEASSRGLAGSAGGHEYRTSCSSGNTLDLDRRGVARSLTVMKYERS
jgi:hypothetical protein